MILPFVQVKVSLQIKTILVSSCMGDDIVREMPFYIIHKYVQVETIYSKGFPLKNIATCPCSEILTGLFSCMKNLLLADWLS